MRPRSPRRRIGEVEVTAYPGIYLHAGLLNDFHFPVCGCDAWDSTWQAEADELERHLLAVVTGHYRETIERRELAPWIGYAFTQSDGASSGGYRAEGLAPERFTEAKVRLGALGGEWHTWPRTGASSWAACGTACWKIPRRRTVLRGDLAVSLDECIRFTV